jgi:hypothetical protein
MTKRGYYEYFLGDCSCGKKANLYHHLVRRTDDGTPASVANDRDTGHIAMLADLARCVSWCSCCHTGFHNNDANREMFRRIQWSRMFMGV